MAACLVCGTPLLADAPAVSNGAPVDFLSVEEGFASGGGGGGVAFASGEATSLRASSSVTATCGSCLVGRYPGCKPLGERGRWNPCCRCVFSSLSDELMVAEIFSFLDLRDLASAAGTCTRWSHLASHPALWSALRVTANEDAPFVDLAAIPSASPSAAAADGAREATSASALPPTPAASTATSAPAAGGTPAATAAATKPSSGCVRVPAARAAAAIRQHADKVRRLQLRVEGATADGGAPAEGVRAVLAALADCRDLRGLDLTGCKHLEDVELRAIVTTQPYLQELLLDGCAELSDATVGAIAAACPYVRRVSLARCRLLTDASVRAMTAAWPGLTLLDLSGCTKVTAEAVLELVQSSRGRLRDLRLRGVRRIGDDFLVALAGKCARLRALDVSLTNPFQAGMLGSRAAAVSGADATVTDAGLVALTARCTVLEELALLGRASLTDAGLAKALARTPLLHSLDLRGCILVGDLVAATLPGATPRLATLRLAGAQALTEAGLAHVARLRRLRLLDLGSCGGFTRTRVHDLLPLRSSAQPGLQAVLVDGVKETEA